MRCIGNLSGHNLTAQEKGRSCRAAQRVERVLHRRNGSLFGRGIFCGPASEKGACIRRSVPCAVKASDAAAGGTTGRGAKKTYLEKLSARRKAAITALCVDIVAFCKKKEYNL